jgi:hypothetical protein
VRIDWSHIAVVGYDLSVSFVESGRIHRFLLTWNVRSVGHLVATADGAGDLRISSAPSKFWRQFGHENRLEIGTPVVPRDYIT